MKDIILDTDIGDDIDDALALTLAMATDRLNLRGIVTVFAEVHTRARIAAKLLAAGGRMDVPVVAGLADPLKHRPERNGWIDWQSRGLSEGEGSDSICSTPGPTFIAQTVEACENPVTLVGIGPLTDLATTLTTYPLVKDHIDEIVIMGGRFSEDLAEWNMCLDPEAAQIVFNAGIPMRVIPLEVTRKCLMSDALLHEVAMSEHPALRYLRELIAGWSERTGGKNPVLHDPLAIGCLMAPKLYSFRRCRVCVNVEPGKGYGVTHAEPDETSSIRICDAVDYDLFAELFATHLLGLGSMEPARHKSEEKTPA